MARAVCFTPITCIVRGCILYVITLQAWLKIDRDGLVLANFPYMAEKFRRTFACDGCHELVAVCSSRKFDGINALALAPQGTITKADEK